MNQQAATPVSGGKLDYLVGWGLGLAAFGLYWLTLAPAVLEADAGEFQFVPWLPGIAHPTGYPLFTLAGWLWTHLLPGGEVAWRMNLFSALLGGLAVTALYFAAGRLLSAAFADAPHPARAACAAVAAATFAVTPTFWSVAVLAEVYTLHALLVALLLLLAQAAAVQPAGPASKGLALLFGLGLAHHSTTVLLLPALLLYLWLTGAIRAGMRATLPPRWLAGHAALAAAPLLLYLYLPLIAPATPYATLSLGPEQTLVLYDNSPAGFVRHITATVFTGELQPAAVGAARLTMVGQLLWQQVGWLGIALAAAGVLFLWQRRQMALLALTGLAALAVTGFNLIYFIGDVFVLFIPVWLVVCLWLGAGVQGITLWAAARFVRRKMGAPEEAAYSRIAPRLEQNMLRLVATLLPLFFFALPALLAFTHVDAVSQRHNTQAAERWQQILAEPLPEAAVLLSNDRNEIMPMWYYQFVEQRRPDLLGLFPLITPQPEFANVGRVLEQALRSGRPVYLIKPMDGLSLKADLQPEGSLVRATPFAGSPAIALDAAQGSIALTGATITPPRAAPGADVTVSLYWQPAQPPAHNYSSFVHLLDAAGNRVAQSDHLPGGSYYPSGLWQPGEVLRDAHTLALPQPLAAGPYRLLAGLYHQPQPGQFENLGEAVEIGTITVD
ncbi:MAG: hypothetical protein Kow0031_24920 [Anaerolineae bacterium]